MGCTTRLPTSGIGVRTRASERASFTSMTRPTLIASARNGAAPSGGSPRFGRPSVPRYASVGTPSTIR